MRNALVLKPVQLLYALVLVLVQLLWGSAAHAGSEAWLVVSCCSKHWGSSRDSNEDNNGVHLRYVMPDGNSISAGGYRNSLSRQSYFAGYGLNAWEGRFGGIRAGVSFVGGIVSGYGETAHDQSLNPFLLPTLSIDNGKVGLLFVGVPGVMVAMGLQFRLP